MLTHSLLESNLLCGLDCQAEQTAVVISKQNEAIQHKGLLRIPFTNDNRGNRRSDCPYSYS